MISHQDKRRVVCAFNSNHKMPVPRYVWHLARCPDRLNRIKQGLPIYKCRYHILHIFLNKQSCVDHEKYCDSKPKEKETSAVIDNLDELTNLSEKTKAVIRLGKRTPFGEVTDLITN